MIWQSDKFKGRWSELDNFYQLNEKKKMKTFWNWISKSSVNADKWSLTFKGFAVAIIPIVITITNLAHVQLQGEQLTQVVDGVVALISAFGLVISAVVTFVGLVRKIYATIKGTNEVLNQ